MSGPAAGRAAKNAAVVVGGGFVGLSSALHLQRVGFRVTLMEAGERVGGRQSASNGNAGTFAQYACIPVQRPGLWAEAPGMIVNPRGALRIAPSPHLVKMMPWALGFLAASEPDRVRKTAFALGSILALAEDGYKGAWEHAGIDVDGPMGEYAPNDATRSHAFAARNGYILLQNDVRSRGARETATLRLDASGGPERLRMEAIDASGVLELEPSLSERAARGGAWWFEDGWFVRDPAALLDAMRDGFEAKGGEIRTGSGRRRSASSSSSSSSSSNASNASNGPSGRVTLVTPASVKGEAAGARAQVVACDGSTIDAGVVVIAAGAHSAGLARQCGDPVPLDTERGYHVQWNEGAGDKSDGAPMLTRPVCTPEGGFIVTPMSGGVRAAGLVELGGTCAPPVKERFGQLEGYTKWLLKDEVATALGGRDASRDWMGFRPTLPDALPVISTSSKVPGVVYAFGHQHVGWTLGGITGRIVADLARGAEPEVDVAPFSARRFDSKPWWRPFASAPQLFPQT